MQYGASFLKQWGQQATIRRDPPVTSYVSLQRVSRSSDPSVRDAVHEGLILPNSGLQSGDVLEVSGDAYLVQSVSPDQVSGCLLWYGLRCNAEIEVKRWTEEFDEATGRWIKDWQTVATTPAWGQIVTARLRQTDPGLLDSARYLFQLPKAVGVALGDRIVYGGRNFMVESVDDIAMPGVVRVQLGEDARP